MNNTLYLIVGPSGSGKTTAANTLEEVYGLKQLQSYTTRPKRHKDETGHIFISDDEFNQLTNIIGYTEYNGYRYCSTKEQVDNSDVYIVDVAGVKTLLERYNSDRPIVILYFKVPDEIRIWRMNERRDKDDQILSRMVNDGLYDWYDMLQNVVSDAQHKNTCLITVPADKSVHQVIDFIVSNCMNER